MVVENGSTMSTYMKKLQYHGEITAKSGRYFFCDVTNRMADKRKEYKDKSPMNQRLLGEEAAMSLD